MKQKLLGNEDLEVAASLNDLAIVMDRQGKLDEAERLHREALARRKKLDHPSVTSSLYLLGELHLRQSKLTDAEQLLREAVARRKNLLGPDHVDVAKALTALGVTLSRQEKLPEAEDAFREALAISRKTDTNSPASLEGAVWNLARVLLQQRKHAEAEPLLLESHDLLLGSLESSLQYKRDSIERLWKFYIAWAVAGPGTGKMEKAREWQRKLTAFDQAAEQKKPSAGAR